MHEESANASAPVDNDALVEHPSAGTQVQAQPALKPPTSAEKQDVKLLLCGDLHGDNAGLDWLEAQAPLIKADVLLFVGDFINSTPMEFLRSVLRILRELAPVTYVIPGNHDPRECLIFMDEESIDGLKNLHRSTAFNHGWSFAGMGGSITTPIGTTPFEDPDEGFADLFALLLPSDVWVLHNPILNQCDKTSKGISVGSRSLRELYDEQTDKPRLVVSGHIHEAHGTGVEEQTTFVNAGPLFEKRLAVIHLSSSEITVEHMQG